ncbi:MAG: helix-turn-helix domain-containing protein [Bacteroidota bacterium]
MNSEVYNTFDEGRISFKPYGLTCELWTPNLMKKPDRHNEIEINYFPEGTITYLLHDQKVNIPTKRLAVFWGLIPHQIVNYESKSPYYVCTIPFSQFIEWELPSSFIDRVLNGELLIDPNSDSSLYDNYLFSNWVRDITNKNLSKVILQEVRARVTRMASKVFPKNIVSSINSKEINQVERITIFIAQNYSKPITASEVGKEVGLHPDYANSIFKKTFGLTLSEFITQERISRAKRELITSDKKILQIAYESGYNSISGFNAAFLKTTGITPREYRKMNIIDR